MPGPLRVLHVIESLHPGGAEMNLVAMLEQMPSEGIEQHVAWLHDAAGLRPRLEGRVASLTPIGASGRGWLPRAALGLRRCIRRHRIDVVHVQLIRAQVAARIAALLAGDVPVVTTWQNAFYEPFAVGDFRGSRVEQQIVRVVDGVTGIRDRRFVAVSRYVAEHLGQALHVPRERIEVVYNALDAARYAPSSADERARVRASAGVPAGAPLLLNVGRLVPQKAQADLVRAMAILVRSRPDVHLLIAGEGPLRSVLESQVQGAGLADRIHMPGARRDLAALYQSADLFVFPSLYEGLSVALVEAMANAIPAVVSDIAQNREVVGDCAAVTCVPVGDPHALAAAIEARLGSRAATRAASEALAQDVRARFDARTLAAALRRILEQAARER